MVTPGLLLVCLVWKVTNAFDKDCATMATLDEEQSHAARLDFI